MRQRSGGPDVQRLLALAVAVAMLAALFVGVAPTVALADDSNCGDPEYVKQHPERCQSDTGTGDDGSGDDRSGGQDAGTGDPGNNETECRDATGAPSDCPNEGDEESECRDAAGAPTECPGESEDEPEDEPETETDTDVAPEPAATGDLPVTGGTYAWSVAGGLILVLGAALSMRRSAAGR